MGDGEYSASQVAAMVSLLNDDSDTVVATCHDALLSIPDEAEVVLREVIESADQVDRPVYESVLADIVASRWEQPIIDEILGDADLERGAVLIGRLVDPDVGPDRVGATLDHLGELAAERLADLDATDPRAQIDALRGALGDDYGLSGAPPNRVHIESATLHGALRDKRGLPLPLCIAWILVGRRAGVPIQGLNMPNHFLIRHRGGEVIGRPDDVPATDTVLDAFHAGRVVKTEDCRRMLRMAGYTSTNLEPLAASDRDMLERTLRNLFMLATRSEQPRLAKRCRRILRTVSKSSDA